MFLKRLPYTYRLAVLVLMGGAVVWGLALLIVDSKLEAQTTLVQNQIEEQHKILASLTDATARNGVGDTTEMVIQDCAVSLRTEFDTLLGRLDDGLSNSELQRLDSLFGRCGDYFALRKSYLNARLAREIEVYETYVKQLEVLQGSSVLVDYKIDAWKELGEAEQTQGELLTKMVALQNEIIITLLEGKSASSAEIVVILGEVSKTRDSLTQQSAQTAELRQVVMTL